MAMSTRHRRQHGFTLIEIMVAIAIGLVLMGLVATGFSMYATYTTNSQAAEWFKQLQTASTKYIADNQASLAAGGTVTFAQLKTGGYLGNGFSATNTYGQSPTLYVIADTGKLQGLICAGGGVLPTGSSQRQIAGMVGLAGGWVASTNPSVAVGKAWGPVNLSTYGLGPGACNLVVALFVSDLASTDDYLHRHATAGQPQNNQMATAIDMNNNNLNNVATVNAKLLNLPAGNSINIGGSLLYGDGSNIATRSPTGGLYIQTSSGGSGNILQVHNIIGDSTSTFTASDMSASDTLYARNAVSTSGSISASGGITAGGDVTANGTMYSNWFRSLGTSGWYSQTYGGGWYMSDPTWIRAYGNKSVYTTGEIRGGTIHSTGDVEADGGVVVNAQVAIGAGCATKGVIAQASNGTGEVVMCKSGRWTAMGGGYTQFQIIQGPSTNGFTNSYATCPAGWTLLSGGVRIAYNPYSFLPGASAFPAGGSSWVAYSTDNQVWVVAYAYCGK